MDNLVQKLRRVTMPPDGSDASDGQLLERFIVAQDAGAFEVLVRRHGPMVWGVCRRITGHVQDAEDAFQACFLVLARKAASIQPRHMVGNWLYGVAYRTAVVSRSKQSKRKDQSPLSSEPPDRTNMPAESPELRELVDDAISRLPDKYRSAVVLCELEGRSRKEAADLLQIAEGTLSSRLAAARKQLADHLAKKGLALPAIGLAAALGLAEASADAACSVPLDLLARTIEMGPKITAGAPLAQSGASSSVVALTETVMRSLLLNRLKSALILGATAIVSLLALGLLFQTFAQQSKPTPIAQGQPNETASKSESSGSGMLLVVRNNRITTVNVDDKKSTNVGEEMKLLVPVVNGSAFSPDGKKFAYNEIDEQEIKARQMNGQIGQTFKIPAKLRVASVGATPKVEPIPISAMMVFWGSDGKELYGVDFADAPIKDGVPMEITTTKYDLATRAKTAIRLPANHLATGISPDGKWFLTTVPSNKYIRLAKVKADGTEAEFLTPESRNALLGKVSPDGRKLLYISIAKKNDPNIRLAVVPFDKPGAEPTLIGPLNGQVQTACWSPDGKKIAYVWRQVHEKENTPERFPTEFFLDVCDADGSNATTLLTENAASQHANVFGAILWR